MKKKAIYNNFIGAFSSFAFLFLTGIVLLPYYFKFISISDYGIWLGGVSFLSLVSVFEANISLILTQQLCDKWINKKLVEFSKYLSAAIFFGFAVGVLVVIGTFFLKDTLTMWLNSEKHINELFSSSFFLYSISLSLTIISGYFNSVSQVFLKTLLPPFFNIIASILGIAYTIWAVPTQGVLAIALGNLVKAFVYSLLLGIYIFNILNKEKITLRFEFIYIINLIKNIGLPFISKVGMTLAVSFQNFIVASIISSTATTVFDITKKIPAIVQMLINMIAVSAFTSFSLFYSEQKSSKETHEYTKHYFSFIRILLYFSLTGVFLLGQDFITFWVGIDKFGGNLLLALLCMSALTDQLRIILALQYYAIGKFNLTAIADTIFAISFMAFAFSLIPHFQLVGIVLSGIFANIIYFAFCFYLEKKYNLNMIANIINRGLFFDLALIILVAGIAKFIYELFGSHIIIGAFTIFITFVILCIAFYRKEKSLINFLVFKFGRASKI